jgi:hypothetical protein
VPTRVLEHSIDLLGAGPGADPPPAPAGVALLPLEGGVRVALVTQDFAPLRALETTGLARALLRRAAGPVATAVRAEAELVFLSEAIGLRFFELVRRGYPRGEFEPRAGGAWPRARYDIADAGWDGSLALQGVGPGAFRASLRLARPAEAPSAAAGALLGLERLAQEWTRELLAHGYTP